MKKTLSALFLGLFASVAAASEAPYLVEPMDCEGRITGDIRQVHPSYHQVAMRFVSFYSTRRDGSLAPSLEVSNSYFGPGERIDWSRLSLGERWYLQPMRMSGNQVVLKNMSGRGDDLKLVITRSGRINGFRVDTLSGTYTNPDSVAGSYGYELNCTARVVMQLRRVDDYTRR